MNEVFGDDVMGALDMMNKVVYLANHGDRNALTAVEEFAHAFVELMGSAYHRPENRERFPENMIYSDLRDMVEKTTLYQRVVEVYGDRPEYRRSDGSLDTAKLKKEAVGQALAVAIVRNFDMQNIENEQDKTFFQRLKEWFEKILDFFRRKTKDTKTLDGTLDEIAKSVLDGTYQRKYLDFVDDKGFEVVSYEDTIREAKEKDGGFGYEIMKNAVEEGAIITGSISVRKQSPIYRKGKDSLHDIDIMVPLSKHGFHNRHKHFRNKNLVPIDKRMTNEQMVQIVNDNPFMQKMYAKIPNLHVMYAYSDYTNNVVVNAISCDDRELVERFESLSGNFNQRLEHFTDEERDKMYLIDFFLRGDDMYVDDAIDAGDLKLAHYKASFDAKL